MSEFKRRLVSADDIASRTKAGVTLIELTLAGVIIVTLGFVLVQFFQAASDGLGTISIQGTLRTQLIQTLDSMSHDVQEAKGKLTTSNCGTSTTSRVSFSVPSLFPNGRANGTFNDVICYEFLSATGEIWRRIYPDVDSSRLAEERPIAHYITNASFTPPTTTDQIKVALIAQKADHKRFYTENVDVEIALRNRER